MNKYSQIPEYVQVVEDSYKSKDSENRKEIIVGGPWVQEIGVFIRDAGIKSLYLNCSKGWRDTDYSFLADLDTVEELRIITSPANNIAAVEGMVNLKELSLTCCTKETVDFSKLTRLKRCYLNWWDGASSIFECRSLENLYLDEIRIKDYSKLGQLNNLHYLTLANCSVESMSWLSQLNQLTELAALNCRKLKDFSSIGSCKSLKRLTIDGSKHLTELDFLSGLYNLEVINISNNGEIENLKPLSRLKNLKAVAFAGSTAIVDGDLSIFESLPKLSMLMFRARKHYSHKLIKKWSWNNLDFPDTLLQRTVRP